MGATDRVKGVGLCLRGFFVKKKRGGGCGKFRSGQAK